MDRTTNIPLRNHLPRALRGAAPSGQEIDLLRIRQFTEEKASQNALTNLAAEIRFVKFVAEQLSELAGEVIKLPAAGLHALFDERRNPEILSAIGFVITVHHQEIDHAIELLGGRFSGRFCGAV